MHGLACRRLVHVNARAITCCRICVKSMRMICFTCTISEVYCKNRTFDWIKSIINKTCINSSDRHSLRYRTILCHLSGDYYWQRDYMGAGLLISKGFFSDSLMPTFYCMICFPFTQEPTSLLESSSRSCVDSLLINTCVTSRTLNPPYPLTHDP